MSLGTQSGKLLEGIAFCVAMTRMEFRQLSHTILGPVTDDKTHTENW